MSFWPKGKIAFLIGIIVVYIISGISVKIAAESGMVGKLAPVNFEEKGSDVVEEFATKSVELNLEAAKYFFEKNFVKADGHIDLYIPAQSNVNLVNNDTNSEAISYYMLWNAALGEKKSFDKSLDFFRMKMQHPRFGYMMWRLNSDGKAVDDGTNIATDADLRAIKALLIAEKKWGDSRYTRTINQLAEGLEKLGVTRDAYLAPYGGVSGEDSIWKADEIWLSYSDFTVFEELAKRRGETWKAIYSKMKTSILGAQIHNGLYNSMLTEARQYGNGIDGGGYSINSMWIMSRNAESNDPELKESARKSLEFYKQKFEVDAELYSIYSSNGDAMSPSDTPWAYALVGRAAVHLDDREFSEQMIKKLIEHQESNISSPLYGAFVEGYGSERRIGQFTMQESIITLVDYVGMTS